MLPYKSFNPRFSIHKLLRQKARINPGFSACSYIPITAELLCGSNCNCSSKENQDSSELFTAPHEFRGRQHTMVVSRAQCAVAGGSPLLKANKHK